MNEEIKTNATIVGYIEKNNENNHKKPPISKGKKKIFKDHINIFKVALYMLKNKKGNKKKQLSSSISGVTNATLTNFVGKIRPLHYQSSIGGMSPPPPLDQAGWEATKVIQGTPANEAFEASPYHPKYASSLSSSSSSRRGMSSYASAQSLYDLDDHNYNDDDQMEKIYDDDEDEDEDEDAYHDGLEGDEMIDFKADVFIAKFYKQMRLQDKS
ncbi:uncharacterized protein LOC130799812 [Amaranthus tricolor]|uniref:uncharacterized protein LOC130799812 n=1 Tax=Amaranthus tricolor TaxID=29722 RepID=UPI002583564F|nr:uncharacterized protein LOC130799812 [Amaranthus tricolor]